MPNGVAQAVPSGTEAGSAGVPLGEFAVLDVDRLRRTGVPEVVFGQGKTSEQIFALLAELRARDPEARLATRCPADVLDGAASRFRDAVHADHVAGRFLRLGPCCRARPCAGRDGRHDGPGSGPGMCGDAGRAGCPRAHPRRRWRPGRRRCSGSTICALPSARWSRPGWTAPCRAWSPDGQRAGDRRADQRRRPASRRGGLAAAASMPPSTSRGSVVVNIDNGFGRPRTPPDHPRGSPVTDRPAAAYIDATAGAADMSAGLRLADAGADAGLRRPSPSLGVPGLLRGRPKTARRGGSGCRLPAAYHHADG